MLGHLPGTCHLKPWNLLLPLLSQITWFLHRTKIEIALATERPSVASANSMAASFGQKQQEAHIGGMSRPRSHSWTTPSPGRWPIGCFSGNGLARHGACLGRRGHRSELRPEKLAAAYHHRPEDTVNLWISYPSGIDRERHHQSGDTQR